MGRRRVISKKKKKYKSWLNLVNDIHGALINTRIWKWTIECKQIFKKVQQYYEEFKRLYKLLPLFFFRGCGVLGFVSSILAIPIVRNHLTILLIAKVLFRESKFFIEYGEFLGLSKIICWVKIVNVIAREKNRWRHYQFNLVTMKKIRQNVRQYLFSTWKVKSC